MIEFAGASILPERRLWLLEHAWLEETRHWLFTHGDCDNDNDNGDNNEADTFRWDRPCQCLSRWPFACEPSTTLLCSPTTPTPLHSSLDPSSRLNILLHFSTAECMNGNDWVCLPFLALFSICVFRRLATIGEKARRLPFVGGNYPFQGNFINFGLEWSLLW